MEEGKTLQEIVPKGSDEEGSRLRRAMVSKKRGRERDWATDGVAGVLRLASRAQSAFFSDLKPGLEFETAVRCCNLPGEPTTDIVLADQPVRDTLYRLARLPSVAWDGCVGRSPSLSPLKETRYLLAAVLGSATEPAPYRPVNLCEFAMRSPQARKELVQWLLVPLFAFIAVAQLLVLFLLFAYSTAEASGGLDGSVILEATATSFPYDGRGPVAAPSSMGAWAAIHVAAVALSCYLGLVLPAARVVLWERDAYLARGIRAACRHVASRKHHNPSSRSSFSFPSSPSLGGGTLDEGSCPDTSKVANDGRGRVVAVLGFLHVNGVAERLLMDYQDDFPGYST
jgi:hypothetical protein